MRTLFIFELFSPGILRIISVGTLLKTSNTVRIIAGRRTRRADIISVHCSVRILGETHLQCLIIVTSQCHAPDTELFLMFHMS